MVVGKSVIVAGIGSRKGVSAQEVLDAIDAALAAHGLGRDSLSALATTDFKRDETGIFEAAHALGLELIIIDEGGGTHIASGDGSALATPSPLWGSEGRARPVARPGRVRGGGAPTSQATKSIHAQPINVNSPPPLAPPHKGEGDVGVAPDERTLTHSPLSLQLAGTPSVSESAALGAAGPGARLLGPRIATGHVTCALAASEPTT